MVFVEAYTREITSSDTVNNSEDHTLYARWTAGEYTVSFNSNGGSAVSPIGVTYGKKYGNLPLPTKPGYTFDGWYTDSGEKVTADSTVNVDRNHTLNAKWRENTYTVRFNPTGGSVSGSTKSIKYGQSYGDLPTPTKAGYKLRDGTLHRAAEPKFIRATHLCLPKILSFMRVGAPQHIRFRSIATEEAR